ncbi:MAG: alginate lyase family protein [Proteobacteria bacterium]|nr:alginate lyase family protein [Pseudomonadota bacterium]
MPGENAGKERFDDMTKRFLELLRRGWRKPPPVIARWLARQVRAEWDQFRAPGRARALTPERLLVALGGGSLDALWKRRAEAPFPAFTEPITPEDYDKACPGDRARILKAAEDAIEARVDLLGSGPVTLGRPIPWHQDFKSGHRWPMVRFRRIEVMDLDRDSDVKVPWELSRLQWLIPAGQAYLLTGDEKYADAARAVIEDWARANPLARGVNWACTMDVALRGITLVWLFRVFHHAAAWAGEGFRNDFLKLVYLHGDFTSRHLEWSDVNGNHLLADAAGLVVMGLFLDDGDAPRAWQAGGWKILADELPKQVFGDGVDFEASCAYHRLVLELFLLPALYRQALGKEVPDDYARRLRKMAAFTAAYSRTDGTSPLWGDADDGRVLPFGPRDSDHRALIALAGIAFDDADLLAMASGPPAEVFWMLGPEAAARIPAAPRPAPSQAFADGGVYVMRGNGDHVFIDCGPVGMAGRGGHGHNDCLSFEAALLSRTLITDCGTFVYTADPKWRNDFRSTAFHNTPMVDAQEINRFVGPEYLWTLKDDARPEVRHWRTTDAADVFVGAHGGYRRLAQPVTPVRAMMLDKLGHRLVIADRFEGTGEHAVRIPYHLALGVEIEEKGRGIWKLRAGEIDFLLVSDGGDAWKASLGEGWVSPSYGIKHPARVLNFVHQGALAPLAVALMPAEGVPDDPVNWLREAAAGLAEN